MSKSRVVISGINGFVGQHLARKLYDNGMSVIGVSYEDEAANDIKGVVDEYHQANLIEKWPDIENVVAIIHLAGLAAVGPSFDKPQKYINANSSMVTNLCEFYVNQTNKPRIVIVSSGAIYDPSQPMPINETARLGINSPYAVSKVLNENQATYYRNRGLDCVIVRPFNHIGPGQGEGFILPDLYARLTSLNNDEHEISVGNIESRRDYTDVRDVVSAYVKIALAPNLKHSLYNICSGESLSGADVFNNLKQGMNLPDISFRVDQKLVRPTDTLEIVGDSDRLQTELGWHPTYTIEQTITDFIKSRSKPS